MYTTDGRGQGRTQGDAQDVRSHSPGGTASPLPLVASCTADSVVEARQTGMVCSGSKKSL